MKVLITGVSSGIGWGLTKFYLSLGFEVYGMSRRVPELFIKSNKFHHLSIDLSDIDNIKSKAEKFIFSINTIDLVILNAGILGEINDLKNQTIPNIKSVMEINVWSNKVLIDTVTESLKSVETVVAISSGASVNGSRGWGGYSLSKASLNMLIKLYASENSKTNFYAFAPGLVDTSMQDYLCSGEIDPISFPASQKLINARYTDNMPSAEKAGEILANAISKLNKLPSGSFADIRTME
jgi:NAD(P)-dependent dehydrogenase (short-subunit alcohol dehydrogenase family)